MVYAVHNPIRIVPDVTCQQVFGRRWEMNKNKVKGYSLIAVAPAVLFLAAWLKAGFPVALGLLAILTSAAILATVVVKGIEFLVEEEVKETMRKIDEKLKKP